MKEIFLAAMGTAVMIGSACGIFYGLKSGDGKQARFDTLNEMWELVNEKTRAHNDSCYMYLLDEDKFLEHESKSNMCLEIQSAITDLMEKEL